MQTPNVENDREAQFLAAQNARLANIRKCCEYDADELSSSETKLRADEGTVQHRRKAFWFAFKDECRLLSSRLDTLYKNSDSESRNDELLYVTAQQRNAALSKLHDIQWAIRALHHYTLNSNKLTVAGEEYLPAQLKGNPMPELPVADQRLTNVEIQTLKEKSQIVQNVICPKERFRFRRYRNLMDKRGLSGQSLEEEEGKEEEEKEHDVNILSNKENDESSEGSLRVLFNGITLEDKKNCKLIVQNDGTIKSMDSVVSDGIKLKGDTAKSFLIRALDNCEITVYVYMNLHNQLTV